MCISQGYVPPTCQLDGQMCWLLIQGGKDPCKGCNYDRSDCKGRHLVREYNEFDGYVSVWLKEYELKRKKEQEKLERGKKHVECNAKVILSITTETSNHSGLEVEIKINNLCSEEGYVARFKDIPTAINIISVCVKTYKVQQIQCEMNGYGIYFYDALCAENLDVDIVPLTYRSLRLSF